MDDRPGARLLHALPRFADQGTSAYRPGLERMHALLEAMGNPHLAFPAIHVAGTNGKGSTASMLAAIGSSLGLRIGLHTSPHLVDVTERMRLDGRPAPTDWLEERVLSYRLQIEQIGPSFFEATSALSFLYFAEVGVDAAVVEVGMGGRLDATNVLSPDVCIITRIGLDHQEHLGDSLALIAAEKAGIAKHGRPLVLYPAPPEVLDAVRRICAERGAILHESASAVSVSDVNVKPLSTTFSARTERALYPALQLDLAGEHQVENASVAIRSAEVAWGDRAGFDAALREGLATVRAKSGLRGRMEVLRTEPLLIADVAHNPDGLARVLQSVEAVVTHRSGRLYVVFAVMADKDVAGIARLLSPSVYSAYCANVGAPRALDAATTARILQEAGIRVHGIGPLESGLASTLGRARPDDVVLVTGSHLLVGASLQIAATADPAPFGTAFAD